MVDMNGTLRPDQAIRSAKALAEFDLSWIEEPIPPWNESGYRQFETAIDTPSPPGKLTTAGSRSRTFVSGSISARSSR